MTIFWLRDKLHRDTAPVPFLSFVYRDYLPSVYLTCTAIAPAPKKICTWTAKSTPYLSCHRDNFLAKVPGPVAGWLRQVTQPPFIAGPLCNINHALMKLAPCFIILSLSIVCSCRQSGLGYAIINPNLSNYETDSTSCSFDRLHTSRLSPRPVRISRVGNLLNIENTQNDGFNGIDIEIILNPQLKIMDANYYHWGDIIDGNETSYRIKKINLELNKNPFLDSIITGRYSLLINHKIRINKELKRLGIKDTSFFSTFNGKFKIYSDDEIKTNMTLEHFNK